MKEVYMRNTNTLEQLTQKPLNAKYYPFDLEAQHDVVAKQDGFFAKLSNFIIEVMAIIKKPD